MNNDKVSEAITVIDPVRTWGFPDFSELFHYRDLIYFLVWRGIKVTYAQKRRWVGLGSGAASIADFCIFHSFWRFTAIGHEWGALSSILDGRRNPLDLYGRCHDYWQQ